MRRLLRVRELYVTFHKDSESLISPFFQTRLVHNFKVNCQRMAIVSCIIRTSYFFHFLPYLITYNNITYYIIRHVIFRVNNKYNIRIYEYIVRPYYIIMFVKSIKKIRRMKIIKTVMFNRRITYFKLQSSLFKHREWTYHIIYKNT